MASLKFVLEQFNQLMLSRKPWLLPGSASDVVDSSGSDGNIEALPRLPFELLQNLARCEAGFGNKLPRNAEIRSKRGHQLA